MIYRPRPLPRPYYVVGQVRESKHSEGAAVATAGFMFLLIFGGVMLVRKKK